MLIRNEDIQSIITEIPEGHLHLRTTLVLRDGTQLVFQEAAIANLVRAYIDVKTHPTTTKIVMHGARIEERKDGYSEWQLLEE
jgi:hypothetical protein